MSIRTKFKIGDRVLYLNEDGIECLGTINQISVRKGEHGLEYCYSSAVDMFMEHAITGRVYIRKTVSRAKKKIEELKNLNGSAEIKTTDASKLS